VTEIPSPTSSAQHPISTQLEERPRTVPELSKKEDNDKERFLPQRLRGRCRFRNRSFAADD
jgi:hypothetical protein